MSAQETLTGQIAVATNPNLFLDPPVFTANELEPLIRQLMQHHQGRFTLVFDQPVRVPTGFSGRHHTQEVSELKHVKFFTASGTNSLAYTVWRRHGFMLWDLPIPHLRSVIAERQMTPDEQRACRLQEIAAILRRIHPNAWDDLRQKPPEAFLDQGGAFSIRSKFPDPEYVIGELREAFDQKKPVRFTSGRSRRHLSVETKMCEDGIFRAWFSSEYWGCGNGCYYLLINPTTAAFGEYD